MERENEKTKEIYVYGKIEWIQRQSVAGEIGYGRNWIQ